MNIRSKTTRATKHMIVTKIHRFTKIKIKKYLMSDMCTKEKKN